MFIFLIVIQLIISILLVTVILMQSGRGGGLVESFSSVESIFGAKTNVFMVRTTAVLATLFLLNCLVLTYLSTQKSKSLMQKQVISEEQQKPAQETKQEVQEPKQMSQAQEVKKEDTQEQLNKPDITESKEEEIDSSKSQQE